MLSESAGKTPPPRPKKAPKPQGRLNLLPLLSSRFLNRSLFQTYAPSRLPALPQVGRVCLVSYLFKSSQGPAGVGLTPPSLPPSQFEDQPAGSSASLPSRVGVGLGLAGPRLSSSSSAAPIPLPFSPLPRPAPSCQSSAGAEASGSGGRRDGQLRHSPAAAIRGKIGRPAPPSSGSDRPSPRRYPSTPPSVPPLLLEPRLSGR